MKPQEPSALWILRRAMLLAACGWTVALIAFAVFEYIGAKHEAVEMARMTAANSFQKDVAYRHWAAMHGGVYVPVTEQTPPNALLADLPERDISTPSGRRLTLMNPAYMTRQVHEWDITAYGVTGHIASLKPIRPANVTDAWESAALKAFEGGTREVSSIETINGEPVLRFMRPLITEKSCLKCHEAQGYKEGDVRGGISVAVPMKTYFAASANTMETAWIWGGGIWMLGLVSLQTSYRRMRHMIQQREESAQHLREAQDRLRLLYDSMLEGVALHEIVCDANGQPCDYCFLQVNPAFERLTGLKAADIIGKTVREALPGIDRKWIERYSRVALTGEPCQFEGCWPDMGRHFEVSALCPRKGQLAVTFSDITERKATDEAQRQSRAAALNMMEDAIAAREHAEKSWAELEREVEEHKRTEMALRRLATAVEQSAETVAITDANGTILYTNPAFEKTSGYTREEAAGQNPRILKSGKHDAEFYRQMWTVLSCGEVWSGRIINKRKDGTLYEEDASISPVRNGAGKIVNYVAVKRDITREAKLEAQLRQSQKMEAVGRLAGGVAHDFNNLLTVMRGRADLVLCQLPPGSKHAQDLQEVVHAVERAAGLTRQLLTFSRQQPLHVRPLDLNAVVNDITKMLWRIVGEDITLRVRCAEALPAISADVGMMEQVIMNLAVNARDAMPKGGQFTLETTAEQIDAEYVQLHPDASAGTRVCLSVSDTGCGIPPEVLPRIFDPFFTTKAVGKGTGLGLATVYGIVKQHHGWINVYSEVNQGTVFRIYLPVSAAAAGVAAPAAPIAQPVRGGTETILVVEDEVTVREMVRLILARRGYRILEAGSGVAALEVWKEQADQIDLVLTDMVMPDGLSGWELAQTLWAHKPQLKVIYTSGYSAESVGHEFVAHGQVHFLQKPYEPRKLLEMVRQCLDGPGGSQTGQGPSA